MALNEKQDSIEPFIPDSVSSHDMAFSNFSQVIFPDIPDFFPPESDISVSYILTDAIEPSTRDWIGLFRVGWASPRDYSTYVWAPNTQSRTRVHTVSFQVYQLPGDDKEFYQFCYVTKQGYVRGASTPFQFRLSTENDCLVEMEDENGMIILRTKSDALEEQLSTLNEDKTELEERIKSMIKDKNELNEKVETLEAELSSAQAISETAEKSSQEMKQDLNKLNGEISKLKELLEKKISLIKTTKSSLKSAEKTIVKLTKEIEESEQLKKKIADEKAAADEKYLKDINEKEGKILEYERNKITMLDQIKTLTLVKEESQKQCIQTKASQEECSRTFLKTKESLLAKLQCCKDERDLFKVQLTESELARQETIQRHAKLSEELDKAEKKLKENEEKLKLKEEDIISVTGRLNQLEKKYKHENSKHQELLRNSLERVNGEKTAKNLLSKELSETTASRDKLMNDLIKVKKEKEELVQDVESKLSVINSLQAQLQIVEEKLEKSEVILLDHEKFVVEERKKAEQMEAEMHEKIILLQNQLREADSAVAAAAFESSPTSKTNKRTQTASQKCENTEDKSSDGSKAISDLKSQVEDLTTRLNMGADAYREKFMECHKLEKKLKKLKQVLQTKQDGGASAAPLLDSPTTATSTGEPIGQGWGSALEKFIAAITDPDAEAKEQAKQVQAKMESLQKNLEAEQGKHRKYKQLYNDEKEKLKGAQSSMKSREEELTKALNDAEMKNFTLQDENKMLNEQLDEFMMRSQDVRVKRMMDYRYTSTSDPNSSPDMDDEERSEDIQFQDAVSVPMSSNQLRASKSSSSDISTSDDVSDDGKALNRSFAKFNICADRNEEGTGSDPLLIPRKTKVISSQPIRSPPHARDSSDTSTSQSSTSRSSANENKTRRATKRCNRKGKKARA